MLKTDQLASAVKVTVADLPLSCPMPKMTIWNMHPKVYLAINQEQKAVCPYCGTQYVFEDE